MLLLESRRLSVLVGGGQPGQRFRMIIEYISVLSLGWLC